MALKATLSFETPVRLESKHEAEGIGELSLWQGQRLMLTDHDSDWNIEDVTDTEICAAIRYLEPDIRNASELGQVVDKKDNGGVICICLYTALLVCFAFFWFYWR